MDSVTRQLVRLDKSAQRQARSDQRQAARKVRATQRTAQQAKQQAAATVLADKKAAVEEVMQAAKEAVGRMPESAWLPQNVVKACNHSGPHHGIRCVFRGRRRVTLVKIPGARGGCRVCRHADPTQEPSNHLSVWLGSDGRIYRVGHHDMNFRANLMDRQEAAHIRALVPKLKAMK